MSRPNCIWLLVLIGALQITTLAQEKPGELKIRPYVFEYGGNGKIDAELGTFFVPEPQLGRS